MNLSFIDLRNEYVEFFINFYFLKYYKILKKDYWENGFIKFKDYCLD